MKNHQDSPVIEQFRDSGGFIILLIFSLFSMYLYYISGHKYDSVLTLVIGTSATIMYEAYRREKIMLDQILTEIRKKNINFVERVDREDMYRDTLRVILGTQRHLLIIQRSPTVFFGARPQGKEIEEEFENALNQIMKECNKKGRPKIIYGFSVYDPKFIKELEELMKEDNVEHSRKVIEKIFTILKGNLEKNKKNSCYFLPLYPKEFPHPMVVSDEYIALWLTEISGNNLYIEFRDKKIARDIFENYERKCEHIRERSRKAMKELKRVIKELSEKNNLNPNSFLPED